MTIQEWILLLLGIIIVAPIVTFLCMKLGTFGFYRGKEAAKRQSESNDIQNDDETEN